MSKLLQQMKDRHVKDIPEEMSMLEYLEAIKKDPGMYASPAERLLRAIGKPKLVDTAQEDRLSRLHRSRVISVYEAFKDFYGMEEVIEKIVGFIKHAAQGLEEDKQILYLLGPVGSAKSSLAIRLRELMQKEPIYVLKGSPVQESPLGLFSKEDAKDLGIEERYLRFPASAWAHQRLKEFEGDLSKFVVQKVYPNEAMQRGITVAAAGDPNTQDISTLVGKVDIRKLESLPQNHPDAYSYSGALCKANQGMMEFVEMFKADIKLLNPLLTATQEGNYVGTENIGLIPFDGIVLAHSNESEWSEFAADSKNEAILDRITVIKVPYVLSVAEEIAIYKKMLAGSQLKHAPCAPYTLEALATFAVLTRLDDVKNVDHIAKLRVYNGENVREKYPNTPSYTALREQADKREGFDGWSTRDSFKILSRVFNYDREEVAANPVHLMLVLKDKLQDMPLDDESYITAIGVIDGYLTDEFHKKLSKDIQIAFLGSGMEELGQNKFERYLVLASHWLEDNDYRDPDTGQLMDRELLNQELESLEKPARIMNHKDFRDQTVRFALQYQAKHGGEMPAWNSYYKIREVLEKSMFNQVQDLIPVLSVAGKGTSDQKQKHKTFVSEMKKKGYTARQVQILQDWFIKQQQSKS